MFKRIFETFGFELDQQDNACWVMVKDQLPIVISKIEPVIIAEAMQGILNQANITEGEFIRKYSELCLEMKVPNELDPPSTQPST